MIREFKFCNYDASRSDFDSKDGEIIIPTNLHRKADGTLGPGIKTAFLAKLPDNLEALVIHNVGNQQNVIMKQEIAEGMTAIYHAAMNDVIVPQELEWICNLEAINCVEICSNIIVIATVGGLRYLVWDGRQYKCVDLAKTFPTIEFGLRKAGTLTCAETFVINGVSQNANNDSEAGSGAYRPHPSAETEREDYAATFKGIAKAYTDAVDEQVVSKGYFHQPFFIRYAMRMADGTHIMPSAPMLMLPTVLPPCLGLSTTTDSEGKCTITTEFSGVKYFELVYRMNEELPATTKALVTAIDIFASPMIPTFDESRLNDGYISTYSKALDARTTGENRGNRGTSRAEEMIFEGHYSDGNDNFTSHYITQDNLGKKAFMIHPNLDFQQEISMTGDFFKIATIPCTATNGFSKVQPDTANLTGIEKGERLRDLPLGHCNIIATALQALDDALIVATEGMTLPPPYPIESMWCTRHTTGDCSVTPIDITVYSHVGGEIRRISRHCTITSNLSEAIPRYVFYPDRRAFLMTISDTESTYTLPLQPHGKLAGAFWTGGTATDYLPTPIRDPVFPEIDPDANPPYSKSTLLISDKSNIFAFDTDNSTTFTQTPVTALCRASVPPKSGTFGRHNLYAFASEGIWMLEYSEGCFKSTHKISSLCCNNRSVADTGQHVYFVSAGRLYHLSGSEIKIVSDKVDSLSTPLYRLPHWKLLLEESGMTMEECVQDDYFSECGLIHSAEMDAIIVFRPDKDYSLVYSPDNEDWMISDININGKIKTPAGYLATAACRNKASNIVRIEREDNKVDSFLVTRPIKLSSPFASHSIRSIEILGYFVSGNVRLAAYGTDDLRHWCLIGSSTCQHLENFNTTGYRMIRICVAARLSEGEYLYGVRINADD